jgi:hypothetical protein
MRASGFSERLNWQESWFWEGGGRKEEAEFRAHASFPYRHSSLSRCAALNGRNTDFAGDTINESRLWNGKSP